MDKKDESERRINDFAARSFRDPADGDYIAARLACRAGLMPQFLWSAQQAFEKYLKYIFLVNRIKATKVGHNIAAAMALTEQLSFKLELRPQGRQFIEHVARYGEYRYLDVSYFVQGPLLLNLDMAVWDLRRYCQILNVFGKELPTSEQQLLADAQSQLKASAEHPPQEFRINRGFLESVLNSKSHPARAPLVWQNAFFGARKRNTVKIRDHLQVANSPLHLYPEMLDELVEYVHIPKGLQGVYRTHLNSITSNPSTRP